MKIRLAQSFFAIQNQGAETSGVCVCTKIVCVKFTEPKVCTVGIYGIHKGIWVGICTF